MPFCHWDPRSNLNGFDRQQKVAEALVKVKVVLKSCTRPGRSLPSDVLSTLVESTSHYLIGIWPRQGASHRCNADLPFLLAHIFITFESSAPDVALSAAVTLAAAAVASRTYPGESASIDAREKRAVNVLRYYQAKRPSDKSTILALFLFGFCELLLGININDEAAQQAATEELFNEIKGRMKQYDFSIRPRIHTFSRKSSLKEMLSINHDHSFLSSITGSTLPGNNATLAKFQYLPLLIRRASPRDTDTELYVLALRILCRENTSELRDLCLSIIEAQAVPENLLDELGPADDSNMLNLLCRELDQSKTDDSSIATLHFGLLVARSIMCSSNSDLPNAQHLVIQSLDPLCD
ncbi:hypothetical protein FRC07_006101 [Ceratobasidium sp. 392]|nr:hypothetical protein FRC07_006101 [Ceratobasidium sp. 392]